MRSSRSAMPYRWITLCSTPPRKCSIGSRKTSASIPLQPATLWPSRCATTRPMCSIPPIRSPAASPKARCQKTPDTVCMTMWQALAAFLGMAHFRSNPQMVQQSSCPECHFQSPPNKDATYFRPLSRSTALADQYERENAESARVILPLGHTGGAVSRTRLETDIQNGKIGRVWPDTRTEDPATSVSSTFMIDGRPISSPCRMVKRPQCGQPQSRK